MSHDLTVCSVTAALLSFNLGLKTIYSSLPNSSIYVIIPVVLAGAKACGVPTA